MSRSARGSSPTARTCARASPATAGCSERLPRRSPRSGSWVPSRTRSAASRGSRAPSAHDLFARQKVTSIVFDVELIYLARRRGYRMAIVPIRWADRRGSRMRARPGLALRVAWDLFRIPLLHRGRASASRRGRRRRRRLPVALGPRGACPIVAIVVFAAWPSATLAAPATRSASTSSPTTRRPLRLLDGEPLYDPTFEPPAASACSTTRRRSRRPRAVRAPVGDRPRLWAWTGAAHGCVRRRGRAPAGARTVRWWIAPRWPACPGRSPTR